MKLISRSKSLGEARLYEFLLVIKREGGDITVTPQSIRVVKELLPASAVTAKHVSIIKVIIATKQVTSERCVVEITQQMPRHVR